MIGRGWGAHRARMWMGGIACAVVLLGALSITTAAEAWVVPDAAVQGAGRLWTTARMKEAKPLEVKGPGGGSQIAFDGPVESAGSRFDVVPDPTSIENRVNGVIFIRTPFGFGRCSGTSVNAPNYSVVFTAAHCIHTGGKHGIWLDFGSVFVPGFRYGQRPFGVFPVKWIDTTPQWRIDGSENFDIGAAVVGRNERGQLLAKAVGGTGIAWGLKAAQVFDVHGYPAEDPFDGETQRICAQTPFLGHDAGSFLSSGPLNLAVECNVTGGASGGGWTIRDGILNSVTNYGYGDDPRTDFGAYFGKDAGRLYHRAGRVK